MDRRKQPLVGDQAAGLSTSAIQTQVSHDPHAGSTRAGGQMLQGETPGGERLGDEIDAAGREEPIQVSQYPFLRGVLPAERPLERQVASDGGGQVGLSSNGCGWVEARSAGRRGVLAVHLTGGGRGAPWRDIVGAE